MGFPPVYNPLVANPQDGENITLCKILDALTASSGSAGGVYLGTSSEAKSGTYSSIRFVTAGTLTTLVGNVSGATGVSFPAGFVLNGLFTDIVTGTATVVVYI